MNTLNTPQKPLGLQADFKPDINDNYHYADVSTSQMDVVNRWMQQVQHKENTSPLPVIVPIKIKKPSLVTTLCILLGISVSLLVIPPALWGYYMMWSLLSEVAPIAIHSVH